MQQKFDLNLKPFQSISKFKEKNLTGSKSRIWVDQFIKVQLLLLFYKIKINQHSNPSNIKYNNFIVNKARGKLSWFEICTHRNTICITVYELDSPLPTNLFKKYNSQPPPPILFPKYNNNSSQNKNTICLRRFSFSYQKSLIMLYRLLWYI